MHLTKQRTPSISYKSLDLTIEVFAAQSIPLPLEGGKKPSNFRPYLKVELHVEETIPGSASPTLLQQYAGGGGGGSSASVASRGSGGSGASAAAAKEDLLTREKEATYKLRSRTHRGVSPDFGGEVLAFRAVPGVVVASGSAVPPASPPSSSGGDKAAAAGDKAKPGVDSTADGDGGTEDGVGGALTFVRFSIRDDERMGRDGLAAWAAVKLDRLAQGYRFLRLMDARGQVSGGVLLVKVTKNVY